MPSFSQSAVERLFPYYDSGEYYDEMFESPGVPRPHYRRIFADLAALDPEAFEERRQASRYASVGRDEGIERAYPLDPLPRILPRNEWTVIERGLAQRLLAIDCFLRDIYGPQRILNDGPVPRSLLLSCRRLRQDLVGLLPSDRVHAPLSAFNLVRDSSNGGFLVLADHLRTPSGLSFVMENRTAMSRTYPGTLHAYDVEPVDHWPVELNRVLQAIAPPGRDNPAIVLLARGINDPAYCEHAFLAQQIGLELVEARDLMVDGNAVYMKTIHGLSRVDVIYRALDEDSIDGLARRSDSLLGVPGLLIAFRAGNVSIANHPGSAIAADGAIYALVPDFIRYYLGEEPILRNVETWICSRPSDLAYVLANLDQLVVKAVARPDEYSVLVGPAASRTTLQDFRDRLRADPSNYIAQPFLSLSRCPAYDSHVGGLAPRHIDFRAYCLYDGARVSVLPGGLTRVALKPGATVIKSHQSSAGKDTWVLRSDD